MAKVWKARETTVKIDEAADVTITELAALDTFFSSGTAIEGKMKNVTIVVPEGDVEKIDLLGVDTNSFQNAELDDKTFGLAEISGTLLVDSGEVLETFAYGTGTAISTTHTRYQAGDGNRPDVAILVNLDDGTFAVNIVLDNARITKLGDIRLDAPDGHWEVDYTAKCLPRDYYEEYKD